MSRLVLDQLLLDGYSLRTVEDDIYSVLQDRDAGFYDKGAWVYDLIVGGRAYNRLVWGCPVDRYRDECSAALASGQGPVLDVGCGSLIFTAPCYAEIRDRPLVLVDQSISMLRRGRDRLIRLCGSKPDNITLLQADALDLPFRMGAFATTLSWGVLHVLPKVPVFLHEMARVTQADGVVCLSSLVTDRQFGGRYLKMLARTGEVSTLMSSRQLLDLVDSCGLEADVTVVGNMAFVTATPRAYSNHSKL